jgi:predicted Co/Zn/Cd cation transporter (cation efflux family)
MAAAIYSNSERNCPWIWRKKKWSKKCHKENLISMLIKEWLACYLISRKLMTFWLYSI